MKMQNKIMIKHHFIPLRMSKVKQTENVKFVGNWIVHTLLVGMQSDITVLIGELLCGFL